MYCFLLQVKCIERFDLETAETSQRTASSCPHMLTDTSSEQHSDTLKDTGYDETGIHNCVYQTWARSTRVWYIIMPIPNLSPLQKYCSSCFAYTQKGCTSIFAYNNIDVMNKLIITSYYTFQDAQKWHGHDTRQNCVCLCVYTLC